MNKKCRDPDKLCSYVHEQITDEKMYYVLLDEVQMVDEFEDVLNSFLHIENVDTYVTGSNAKFLSKDIITAGDEAIRFICIHCISLNLCRFIQMMCIKAGWILQCMEECNQTGNELADYAETVKEKI